MFAHLAALYYISTPSYSKDLLKDQQYSNLVTFLETVKKQLWPTGFEKH